jgi:hypothetical protein
MRSLFFVLLFFPVLPLACSAPSAPSAEEVRREFDAYVAARNACSADSDCAIVFAGCPLVCYAAVAVRYQAAAESKARELVDDYESEGQKCYARCQAAPGAACTSGKCEVVTQ